MSRSGKTNDVVMLSREEELYYKQLGKTLKDRPLTEEEQVDYDLLQLRYDAFVDAGLQKMQTAALKRSGPGSFRRRPSGHEGHGPKVFAEALSDATGTTVPTATRGGDTTGTQHVDPAKTLNSATSSATGSPLMSATISSPMSDQGVVAPARSSPLPTINESVSTNITGYASSSEATASPGTRSPATDPLEGPHGDGGLPAPAMLPAPLMTGTAAVEHGAQQQQQQQQRVEGQYPQANDAGGSSSSNVQHYSATPAHSTHKDTKLKKAGRGLRFWGSLVATAVPGIVGKHTGITREFRHWNWITDRVILGALPVVTKVGSHGNHLSQIKQQCQDRKTSIGLVVSCVEAEEFQGYGVTVLGFAQQRDWLDVLGVTSFCHLPMRDFSATVRVADIMNVCHQIKSVVEKDDKCVYIHCKAGKGRSWVMAMCYLVYSGMSFVDARNLIASKRQQVSPNNDQINFVKQFCATVGGRVGVDMDEEEYRELLAKILSLPQSYRARLLNDLGALT